MSEQEWPTTQSKLTHKPDTRSKSGNRVSFRRSSSADLDISSSTGDFETIESWLNWRERRKGSKLEGSATAQVPKLLLRKGAVRSLSHSKSDNHVPTSFENGNAKESIVSYKTPTDDDLNDNGSTPTTKSAVANLTPIKKLPSLKLQFHPNFSSTKNTNTTSHLDDSAYDYIKVLKSSPHSFSTDCTLKDYDYVRESGVHIKAVCAKRKSKELPTSSTTYSSSDDDDDYY